MQGLDLELMGWCSESGVTFLRSQVSTHFEILVGKGRKAKLGLRLSGSFAALRMTARTEGQERKAAKTVMEIEKVVEW
jgi:hypothetical protein